MEHDTELELLRQIAEAAETVRNLEPQVIRHEPYYKYTEAKNALDALLARRRNLYPQNIKNEKMP